MLHKAGVVRVYARQASMCLRLSTHSCPQTSRQTRRLANTSPTRFGLVKERVTLTSYGQVDRPRPQGTEKHIQKTKRSQQNDSFLLKGRNYFQCTSIFSQPGAAPAKVGFTGCGFLSFTQHI